VLYKTLAFGISAAFAGVAGSLFVMSNLGYVNSDTFSISFSLNILIGAAVAGLGSLWGVAAGAAFIALLPNISDNISFIGTGHDSVVVGIVVIVVVLLLPTGVAGLLQRVFVGLGGRRAEPGGISATEAR
jgi:branched-chain amino acid transport system permease protein